MPIFAHSDTSPLTYVINNDVVINENIGSDYVVSIENMAQITNNATIDADIVIANGRNVYIQNAGKINGTIHLGRNVKLVQVINDAGDINVLSVDGDYNMDVSGTDKLKLSQILGIADGVDTIRLHDASILVDALNTDQQITFSGMVKLFVPDDFNYDNPLLLNVSGDNSVTIYQDGQSSLFVLDARVDNSSLYIDRKREVEYDKVLDEVVENTINEIDNETVGDFLNEIRTSNSGDGLIDRLNNATSIDTINSIMGKSVRFNPEILMYPVDAFNGFMMLGGHEFYDGVNVAPIFIGASDFKIYGARIGLGLVNTDDVQIGIGGYAGYVNYESDLDTFSQNLYGGNLFARYNITENNFVRGIFGLTGAATNIDGGIYDGTRIVKNPNGVATYGKVDFGHRFVIADNFYVTPFAGTDFTTTKIANYSDTDVEIHGGTDFGYGFESDGIRYDYMLRASARTDTHIGLDVEMSILSISDMLGGNIRAGIIRDDDYVAYDFMLGIKYHF